MKFEYENIVEEMDNKQIKEMLEVTFAIILPGMIEGCNENQAANLLISLQEMLNNLSEEGRDSLRFENYIIGEIFPEYCKNLVGVMESIPISHKQKTFEIFDLVLINAILGLIITGLENGTITEADIKAPDDKEDDE